MAQYVFARKISPGMGHGTVWLSVWPLIFVTCGMLVATVDYGIKKIKNEQEDNVAIASIFWLVLVIMTKFIA